MLQLSRKILFYLDRGTKTWALVAQRVGEVLTWVDPESVLHKMDRLTPMLTKHLTCLRRKTPIVHGLTSPVYLRQLGMQIMKTTISLIPMSTQAAPVNGFRSLARISLLNEF